jgi:hypothetical protein
MAYILNIGLAVEGKKNLTVSEVLDACVDFDIEVINYAVFESDSEPTLVAKVSKVPGVCTSVNYASISLGQDCIGVYSPATNTGALIGPRADKWGEFNPEYFLLLDGSRLSQPALKLAA